MCKSFKTFISICLTVIMLVGVMSVGMTALAAEAGTTLDLRNQNLTDVSLAAQLQTYDNLENVRVLKIENNPGVTDISAIFDYLPNLTTLYADFCSIATFPNQHLSDKLVTLFLPDNRLTDISNLPVCFPNITLLHIESNQITGLNALAGLSNLEFLYADNNQITSLKDFPFFPQLNKLSLSNNRITDIRWSTNYRDRLDGKQTLNLLNLSHNRIYDTKPLAYFGSISDCKLSNNYIFDISSLPQNTYNKLDLSDNYISDFSVIYNVRINNSLNLAGNIISKTDDDAFVKKFGEQKYTSCFIEGFTKSIDDWFINTEDGILMHYFGSDTDVQIPADLGITTIGLYAFDGNKDIQSVIVPDAVTRIMSYAFSECMFMNRIDLGSGVSQIEELAFYLCTRLAGISVPANVYTLERNVFRYCTNLKSVCFSNDDISVHAEAFYGCTKQDRADPNNAENQLKDMVIYAPHSMGVSSSLKNFIELRQYKYSTDYDVVNGVLTNCYYAGSNASSTDVQKTDSCNTGTLKVPDGVTEINIDNTYTAPAGLKGIAVPEGVKALNFPVQITGTNAVDVLLPDTLTAIGSFINGTPDVTVYCKPGNALAQNYASSKNAPNFTSTTKYEIAYNVVEKYTGTDEIVNIPASFGIDEIGTGAFYSGNEINVNNTAVSITVPEGVQTIGATAFRNCRKAKEINLPDSLETISTSALSNCFVLERADIPEKVTVIAANTFNSNYKMSAVTLSQNLTSIGSGAFQECRALTTMNASGEIIDIPDSVNSIDVSAFEACTSLKAIGFPTAMSQISDTTFKGCTALTQLLIPENIGYIGKSAFEACTALTCARLMNVYYINDNAFKSCTGLESVYYYSQTSGNTIKETAFIDCDATKLKFYGYDGSAMQDYCSETAPYTRDNFESILPTLTLLNMYQITDNIETVSIDTPQNLQACIDEIVLASLEQAEANGMTVDLKALDARICEAEAAYLA